MELYGLCLKNSDEVISKTKARGPDEALSKFSKIKNLSPSKLLKIFKVVKL